MRYLYTIYLLFSHFLICLCSGFHHGYSNLLLSQSNMSQKNNRPTMIMIKLRATTHLSLSSFHEFSDDDNGIISNRSFMNELTKRNEKIQVESLRDQLEHANTLEFLKRRPRKLPYNDARRWIQANLGPNNKEEFYDLVENGNLRTPYIPKRPEEYYTKTREWISWDHFLTGIFDKEQPSAVQPPTGIFD